MIYIAGILLLSCFAFMGFILYCDISTNKADNSGKNKENKK